MIIRQTVKELKNTYAQELERLEELRKAKDTNANKNITKVKAVIKLLDSLEESTTLTIENCWGDNNIRAYTLANVGSVVECIVKAHYTQANEIEKTWSGVDYKRTEIKASLSANSLSTPAQNNQTLLVNLLGVYRINKDDICNYTNKQGRLPHNKPCGKRVEWLSKLLGYDTVEVEA